MSPYLLGIFSAFVEPVLHAWANILDSYLSNKLFQRLIPLIFASSLVGIILIPFVVFFASPLSIPMRFAGILFLIALIEVLYLYPYYCALRCADTSVVASLFSLGKVFVPALAFLFLGEHLTIVQYAGFFILTASSVFLALDIRKMRFNRAFVLMLGVSILLAIQSVLLKYVYEHGVGWGSSIIWMSAFQFLIAVALVLIFSSRVELKRTANTIRSYLPLFLLMELLTWGGTLAGSFAIYLIPISIAKGIASTQPMFVLLYAFLFAQVSPDVFREYLGRGEVIKKALLFLSAVLGVLFIKGV